LAVDVNRMLLAVAFIAANVNDCTGAKLLLAAPLNLCTGLQLICSNTGGTESDERRRRRSTPASEQCPHTALVDHVGECLRHHQDLRKSPFPWVFKNVWG